MSEQEGGEKKKVKEETNYTTKYEEAKREEGGNELCKLGGTKIKGETYAETKCEGTWV